MKKFLVLALASLMLYACSSTSVVSSWTPQDATKVSFKKVLVVGLMGSKERELRENTENAVAQILIANGINAVSAMKVIGPSLPNHSDNKDTIDKELQASGYDGVMLISLIDKEKQVNVNTYGAAGFPGWYGYYSWYGGMYGMYPQMSVTTTTNYALEANLYTVTPEKLIYSAQTKSYDPSNATELAKSFASAVIADMQKKGLIDAPAKK